MIMEDLAISGGPKAVGTLPPPPKRWAGEEARFLTEMVEQESLFYWDGPQTTRLLERFRYRYAFEHVMPCSSGTAAIHIALASAQIGWGDEVITSPVTDMGTLIGVLYQQAVPVFADIDPETYNLSPDAVEAALTERTRAIIAVHLAGNPCDMRALREIARKRNLVLIEDCAQAWGARSGGEIVGTLGDLGCYSLNDFKHISCGDGGLVGSNDPTFGPALQRYGDKGYDRTGVRRMPQMLGLNYRMSEPQAAVAAAQMGRVEEITRQQNRNGELLTALIAPLPGLKGPQIHKDDYCTYWFYILRMTPESFACTRDEFVAALAAEGVPCGPGYITMPIYRYPVFQERKFFAKGWPLLEYGATKMDYREVCCPAAERMLETCLTIPLLQSYGESEIRAISKAIAKVHGHTLRK